MEQKTFLCRRISMCKDSGAREVTFTPKECKEDQQGWNREREKGRRVCRGSAEID